MSFINRPDERRRDAAKLARANLARPLVETELNNKAEKDKTFSMIAVHNTQLDDISKNILEILGPFHRVLGGPTNGFRVSRITDFSRAGGGGETVLPVGVGPSDAGTRVTHSSSTADHQQLSSRSLQPNCSSAAALPSGSTHLLPAAVDHKKQQVLQVSLNPSTVSSQSVKSTKPPPISTCESNPVMPSSHNSTVPSSSSPHLPTLSAINASCGLPLRNSSRGLSPKFAPHHSQDQLEGKDFKTLLKRQRSPPSAPLKQETSTKSPMADAASKPHTLSNLSSSKSVQPKSSSGLPVSSSPSQSTGTSSLSGTSNKVYSNNKNSHLVKNTSNQLTISPLLDQTCEPTPITSISTSTSTSTTSYPRDSPLGQIKPDSRTQSTTPPKTKDISPVENPQHSTKLINSMPKSGRGQVTDKTRLSLKMQTERKIPTSKSDLNDILKDLAELHDPLTAIETPRKIEHGFPFSAASGKEPRSEVVKDNSAEVSQKLAERKIRAEKEVTSEQETSTGKGINCKLAVNTAVGGNIQATVLEVNNHSTGVNAGVGVKDSSCGTGVNAKIGTKDSSCGTGVNAKVGIKDSSCGTGVNAKVGIKDSSCGTGVKAEAAIKDSNCGTGVKAEAAIKDSSCGTGLVAGVKIKDSTQTTSKYDVNSILRRDLDLSEDSDAEPGAEDKPVSSQPSKIKVISPTLGAPVKSAVSPMSSSSSSSSSSSDSSSEGSGDEKEGESATRKKKDKKLKKSSDRRLSSSSSSSSSSSYLTSDDEDKCANGEAGGGKHEPEVKLTTNGMKANAEDLEKSSITGPVASAVIVGNQGGSAQDNSSEPGMIWCLKNFIQHPKRNSSSSSSGSPVKPLGSSPLADLSPPSIQQKDPLAATNVDPPWSPPGLVHCDTLPFEPQTSNQGQSYGHANETEVDGKKVSLKKRLSVPSKKELEHLHKLSSVENTKPTNNSQCGNVAAEKNSTKGVSKNTSLNATRDSKKFVDLFKKGLSGKNLVASNSVDAGVKATSDANFEKTGKAGSFISPMKGTAVRVRSSSSSHDEIDVVGFTPEAKSHDRLRPSLEKSVSEDNRQEVCKQLFNGKSTDKSSNVDTNSVILRGGYSPIHDIKHHKRKNEQPAPVTISMTSSTSKLSTKLSGKQQPNINDALDDPETVPKPATHSPTEPPTKSSLSIIPSKLVAQTHSSLSTSPSHSFTATRPSPTTVSNNSHGSNHQPSIMVHISIRSFSKKLLKWLKDKKQKQKNLRPPENSGALQDTLNETTTLTVSNSKALPHNKNGSEKEAKAVPGTLGSSSRPHSMQLSKTSKPKSKNLAVRDAPPTSPLSKKARCSSKEASPVPVSPLEPSPPSGISNGQGPTEAVPRHPPVSSRRAASKLPSTSPTLSDKTSKSHGIKSVDSMDVIIPGNGSRPDKLKPLKRKSQLEGEVPKKAKSSEASGCNDNAASTANKEGHKSTSSKGPHHSASSGSGAEVRSEHIDEVGARATNGPESNGLPFNHYINGGSSTSRASSNNGSLAGSDVPSRAPDLPPPGPIETQLLATPHYLARAREHKHHADSLRDRMAKYEPYLRSGLSFFLAGYSMEMSKRETSTSMYSDTSNLIHYVIKMQTNSSTNPDLSSQERKFISLLIRLQSYVNHRLYRLRRNEANFLRKVIESEQSKLHSTSAAAAASSSSTNPANPVKPHAPSPHQSTWAKNSTRTPSPMSPTPSPGSVSSQGSCELIPIKLQNGTISTSSTPITSPSPSMIAAQQQLQSYSQRYHLLTSPIVKAMEMWDMADAESRTFPEFFAVLDSACGPLSFHSEPPVIVRYMKHALRVLSLWQ